MFTANRLVVLLALPVLALGQEFNTSEPDVIIIKRTTVRVPFDADEDDPIYVFIYFVCALITVMSCAGIVYTEYLHRLRTKTASEDFADSP
eukprot:CAMPEP_0198220020 /NCGR_PEP_ID=MMETSP1445-20131203/77221_1 /TAXON_ID=36898 /ORGANISM="Pyramimonas sp., Strain CCMP2087" /LENGTH=90 /DNA_ID=CAMNT_0043897639 /DNA_START=185 /DNA_END=453 /DNA_ORIENTATION=-